MVACLEGRARNEARDSLCVLFGANNPGEAEPGMSCLIRVNGAMLSQ